jgi:hypothetical protein
MGLFVTLSINDIHNNSRTVMSTIILSVIMLSVIMLSVVMLSVVMLSVGAPAGLI